jgi:hypothetical protein
MHYDYRREKRLAKRLPRRLCRQIFRLAYRDILGERYQCRRARRLAKRLRGWGLRLRMDPNPPKPPYWYTTFEVEDETWGGPAWPNGDGEYGASLYDIELWMYWFERQVDSDPQDPEFDPHPSPPDPLRCNRPWPEGYPDFIDEYPDPIQEDLGHRKEQPVSAVDYTMRVENTSPIDLTWTTRWNSPRPCA